MNGMWSSGGEEITMVLNFYKILPFFIVFCLIFVCVFCFDKIET